MSDSAPRPGPLTARQGGWAYGVFLALMLGLFAAEIVHDYQPAKLSAFLVVLFWVPLLALHETGHAAAAWVLGWHVGQVVIGMGQTVNRFRLGAAVVEVRMFPVEGFVRCVPTNLRLPQLKSAVIYFAGPGVELLLAGLVLLFVGPDKLFSRSDDYQLILWQSLAAAAAAQAVVNLIPQSIQTPRGEMVNDGLGIIRSFSLPEAHYAAMIGQTCNELEETDDPVGWSTPDR